MVPEPPDNSWPTHHSGHALLWRAPANKMKSTVPKWKTAQGSFPQHSSTGLSLQGLLS